MAMVPSKVFFFFFFVFALSQTHGQHRDFCRTGQSHKRLLPKPRPRCCQGEWTRWFDLDNPDDGCDSERFCDIRRRYPREVCPDPTAIDYRPKSGQGPWPLNVWDALTVSIHEFKCCNEGRRCKCLDYEVRYCCDAVVGYCPYHYRFNWSPWMDRDDVPGSIFPFLTHDDNELAYYQKRPRLCKVRTAIEARTADSDMDPYWTTGNEFPFLNPKDGLLCAGASCKDYKVRYCCFRLPWWTLKRAVSFAKSRSSRCSLQIRSRFSPVTNVPNLPRGLPPFGRIPNNSNVPFGFPSFG